MLTTLWLSGVDAIEAQQAMLDDLLRRAKGPLLSQRAQANLLYARAFGGPPDFAEKRGRHLLGAKSVLHEPTWLVIRDENRAHGALPLLRFTVTLRGQAQPLSLLTTGADSFFFPFRDLLVDDSGPAKVVSAVVAALAEKASEQGFVVHLGGIPNDSPSQSHWHAALSACAAEQVTVYASDNLVRGGFFPWNMAPLSRALEAIAATLPNDLTSRTQALCAAIGSDGPLLLAMPGKRTRLASTWADLADDLRRANVPVSLLNAAEDALAERAIGYPHRALRPKKQPLSACVSPSVRGYFKRYGRRFRAAGGSFEHLAGAHVGPADVDDYLDLHAQRWGSESAALGGNSTAFHRDLVLAMAREGATHLVFAKRLGRRLAAVLCFDLGPRRLYYYAGRSLEPDASRAGKLALWEALSDAAERDLSDFDLGYGDPKYKLDLATGMRFARTFLLIGAGPAPDWDGLFPGYERVVPSVLEPKK